jgi:hypothetical protein
MAFDEALAERIRQSLATIEMVEVNDAFAS